MNLDIEFSLDQMAEVVSPVEIAKPEDREILDIDVLM
jgi:hypothetical protein